MPTVSVITPTKNRAELLREAIQSVSVQTFSDWEHVVVDDGSIDETDQLMTRAIAEDARFHFVKRQGEREGANVCRNLGIQRSSGEFLVFLDSDDLLSPTCLEQRVRLLSSHTSLDFMVFQADTFSKVPGDRKKLWHPFTPGDDLNRFLQHECVWDITGPIWRRSVFDRFGLFDEALRSMQDYDLHLRILSKNAKYIKLPLVDHHIRGHEFDRKTSARHFKDHAFLHAVEPLPMRFAGLLEQAGIMTWSRRRLIQGLAFNMAENWAKNRELRQALRAWKCQRKLGTSQLLYFTGMLALALVRFSTSETGLGYRVVNRWKGLMRFRQEPRI